MKGYKSDAHRVAMEYGQLLRRAKGAIANLRSLKSALEIRYDRDINDLEKSMLSHIETWYEKRRAEIT